MNRGDIMNEIQAIIQGYNEEKAILTKRISDESMTSKYSYENSKVFVSDTKKRIAEIDVFLKEIIEKLLTPTPHRE